MLWRRSDLEHDGPSAFHDMADAMRFLLDHASVRSHSSRMQIAHLVAQAQGIRGNLLRSAARRASQAFSIDVLLSSLLLAGA
eukprot:12456820-Alexandrium_andersonii.AAC.1